MAVVINGNGTVTGVTTLPDGIVTNDDLAGSINQSKLAGAIPLSKLVTTGTGSSSNFLRGDGAYAEAGGGAWALISSTNLSAVTTLAFVLDATQYYNYKWIFSNIRPTTNTNRLAVRTSTDGGSSYSSGTSDYQYCAGSLASQAALDQNGNQNANMGVMNNLPVGSSYGQNYEIILFDPSNATVKPKFQYLHAGENVSGVNMTSWGSTQRVTTADVDAVQFLWEQGGTFQASGKVQLLGLSI